MVTQYHEEGQLLDVTTNQPIVNGMLNVNIIRDSDEGFHYVATFTIKGAKPQLGDKTYMLILKKVSGRVFITATSNDFNEKETHFKLIFEDTTWKDWIKSLLLQEKG